jgi:hypothetical protein
LEKFSLEMAQQERATRSEWSPKEKSDGLHLSMLMIVRISLWSWGRFDESVSAGIYGNT